MKELGLTLVQALKSLSLMEGVIRRSQPQFLRLAQSGRLGQSDVRSYYALSSQFKILLDDSLAFLNEKGINGEITEIGNVEIPAIPDSMVRRALPDGVSQSVQTVVLENIPKWEEVFEKNAKKLFDKDATIINTLSKKLLATHSAVMLERIPSEMEVEIKKGIQYAAITDLYVQARLKDEGKPKEVFPSIPGWIWGLGGIMIGGGFGYLIGRMSSIEEEVKNE